MSAEISSYSSKDKCYESFVQSVLDGKRQDRGLNFHLDAGAILCRKTKENWIEEDLQNGKTTFVFIFRFSSIHLN